MTNIVINKKNYLLSSITGSVAASSKHATTEVTGSGGGGGGYTHGGSGYSNTSSISIRSTTTVQDTLFLIDSDGIEHSFELTNFGVSCREGNVLSVIAMQKEGKEDRSIFAVYNHDTRKTHYSDNRAMIPFRSKPVALSLAFVLWLLLTFIVVSNMDERSAVLGSPVVAIGAFMISVIFYEYIYERKPKRLANRFISSPEIKEYVKEQLLKYQSESGDRESLHGKNAGAY